MTKFDDELPHILLGRTLAEMEAQHEQWGEQNHQNVYSEDALRRFARQADSWKQINDARVEDGNLTWDGILLEEVYEALSETEPELRIEELVQVAAVALSEAAAIYRLLDSLAPVGTTDDGTEIVEAA